MQATLTQENDVVEALTSDFADDSLREGILPLRVPMGGEDFLDAQAFHPGGLNSSPWK